MVSLGGAQQATSFYAAQSDVLGSRTAPGGLLVGSFGGILKSFCSERKSERNDIVLRSLTFLCCWISLES